MAYKEFIAAIDLGSSHIVGMVGVKEQNKALSVITYEVESTDKCIRRGCVKSIKDAANKINRLILKLENKLKGEKIAKVYLGIGGQSLRTINHTVTRMLGGGTITDEVLASLEDECKAYHPDMLDIFKVTSPVYFLDNKSESNPLGLSCSRIEAHYKLIVGRPSLRHALLNNLASHIKVEIAGLITEPDALADLVLSDTEKEEGCILIDFGAGVTSVTIVKEHKIVALTVIPLGSDLITRDLMSLNIAEKEAERLKRTFGNALMEKEDPKQTVSVEMTDGQTNKEVKISEINLIVEARAREIIENAYARVEEAGVAKEAGFSVVISGNGSALKNMREAISQRFKMDVRYSSVRKDKIESGEMIANNPSYTMAAALLLQGNMDCAVAEPVVVPEVKVVVQEAVIQTEPDETEPGETRKPVELQSEELKNTKKENHPHEEKTASERSSSRNSQNSRHQPNRTKVPGLFDKVAGKISEMFNEE